VYKKLHLISKIFAITLAGWLLYNLWIFGHIVYWQYSNPSHTAFMKAQENTKTHHATDFIRQRWIPYQKISVHLKRAVIATEDAKFMTHNGFDWNGIEVAMKKNMRRGKLVAGGSTISQQLAKNLFLSNKKTIWRKAEEAIITTMLESVMTKRRILEIYLNTIEWGEGVFGAEAASLHYFGVSAAHLSPAQAAKLAAMISNPRFYDANRYTKKLTRKTRVIIRHMKATRAPSSHQHN